MQCNPCNAPHALQPMQCNPCNATHIVTYACQHICMTTHVCMTTHMHENMHKCMCCHMHVLPCICVVMHMCCHMHVFMPYACVAICMCYHQGWGQVQLTKYSSIPSTSNIYQVQVLVKYSFFKKVLKT